MPICPRGHESQAEDWCDFCGFPMTPPQPLPPPPGAHPGAPGAHGAPGAPYGATLPPGAMPPPPPGSMPAPGSMPPPPPPAPQGFPDLTEGLVICPICRSPQTGRFCEECGYDYDLSSPQRAQQPPFPAPAPPPAPAPLNIPAAYGGAPAAPAAPHLAEAPPPPLPPQHHQQQQQHQQHGAPAGYGYPPPAHGQQAAAPGPVEAPPYGPPTEAPYGPPAEAPYGPPAEAPYGLPPAHPEQQRPPAPREDSGPVYAQPGPARRGDEFGTSFHLAPPVPPQAEQPPAPAAEPVRTTWFAVIAADRQYFTDMMARSGPEAAGLFFPPYCPERRIPLTGRGQLRIGRRSQHRGTVPEIDLSVAPEDPGASHQHALLAEQPDGTWVLVDQDSTNGTTVNGGAEPISPHTAIPLGDGDRVHIGAWTTITLHRA
ncbi:FHA domain-containing protein [Kitasatospora purpeofusca]|uniref:FHA domain-containing protein n=1 Tax=Kitasatospora purpeofusca TaxID=67352 RepID=UPI0035E281EA